MAEKQTKFGSCCAELKEAIDSDEFEPLISEDDDDGILYMSCQACGAKYPAKARI